MPRFLIVIGCSLYPRRKRHNRLNPKGLNSLRRGTEGDKRLRIYFRYDRKLLGKLCRASWESIRDVYAKEVDGDVGMSAMICAVQTFGDLVNYHPHIHTVAPEGVFTDSGYFVHIPYVCRLRAVEIWQEKVFEFLVDEDRIDRETVAMIKSWRHTGLTATIQVAALRVPILSGCSPRIHALRVSVDNSVRIEAKDEAGMQRLIEYICHSVLLHKVFRHIAVLSQ